MPYKVALFDIDGTLSNPGNALMECAKYALSKMGIHETSDKNLRRFVGPPLEHSFKEYYGLTTEQALEATVYYRQKMKQDGVHLTTVYGGAESLLRQLQESGVTLAIVTSKVDYIAAESLRITGLAGYFRYVGSEAPGRAIKKAATLENTLKELEVSDRAQVVMIGDRRHDIEAANTAGVDSIGVLWGYGSKEELHAEGATYRVSKPSDVLSIVLGSSSFTSRKN